jgi:hypothetical protein
MSNFRFAACGAQEVDGKSWQATVESKHGTFALSGNGVSFLNMQHMLLQLQHCFKAVVAGWLLSLRVWGFAAAALCSMQLCHLASRQSAGT